LILKPLLTLFLKSEPLILGVLIVAMWYPSPLRDRYVWLFILLIPVLVARWALRGHIITITRLDAIWLILLVLGIANIYVAPYTRGFIMLARPVLGLVLYFYIIETARYRKRMDKALNLITVLAILTGFLALFGTQWNEKSFQFEPLLNILPTMKDWAIASELGLSFNANEIAGAIAYILPLMAGVAIYHWRMKLPRIGVTLAFVLLFLSLFLGQSRLTIIGVLAALALIIFLLIPRSKWQAIAWAALGLVMILELVVIYNPASRQALAERDEDSFSGRLNIWSSAISMVEDYPLTGVGLNMFRDRRVLEKYPVPRWIPSPGATRILPHTHNEVLQIAADMGIPGVIVFISIHIMAIYMTVQTWRRGDDYARAVSVSAGAGLLAHTIFGIGDAITLWDRFAFLFWVVLGLLRGQHLLTTRLLQKL
jgi:putative inorganic carbon (hco3(-)) transporter